MGITYYLVVLFLVESPWHRNESVMRLSSQSLINLENDYIRIDWLNTFVSEEGIRRLEWWLLWWLGQDTFYHLVLSVGLDDGNTIDKGSSTFFEKVFNIGRMLGKMPCLI